MTDDNNTRRLLPAAPRRKARKPDVAPVPDGLALPQEPDRFLSTFRVDPIAPELRVSAGPSKPRRARVLLSAPTDPADPACWSWKRYTWHRGLDQYKQMRVLRRWHDDRCGICGAETDLLLDHDHGSGWVRGLLCDSCNKSEGLARDTDDVFARWRACPPAAMIGLRVVYDSKVSGIALPMPYKVTGPLSLPDWAPPHQSWPPEPWMPLEASDGDPLSTLTRAELVSEVKRLRQQVADIRNLVSPGTPRDLLAEPA